MSSTVHTVYNCFVCDQPINLELPTILDTDCVSNIGLADCSSCKTRIALRSTRKTKQDQFTFSAFRFLISEELSSKFLNEDGSESEIKRRLNPFLGTPAVKVVSDPSKVNVYDD